MRSRLDSDHFANKIEELRAKPQHVRENIALFVSGGITLMVFMGWLVAFTSSKPFTVEAQSTQQASIENPLDKAKEAGNQVNSLLGAAGASKTESSSLSTSQAKIEIVDAPQPAPTDANATVIHF